MKAKVIETGEIVNVTPYPTWYKENGQGPDRREWDEDELEFIYSNKKTEESLEVKVVDLEKEAKHYLLHEHSSPLTEIMHQADLKAEMQYHKDIENAFKRGFELGLKAKGE